MGNAEDERRGILIRENEMNMEIVRKAAENYHDAILSPFGNMISRGGFDAVYGLINEYGGSDFYVPTKRKVFGPCLEKDLLANYNGKNDKQLAEKYGFTLRHVRRLIKRELKRG